MYDGVLRLGILETATIVRFANGAASVISKGYMKDIKKIANESVKTEANVNNGRKVASWW